MGNNLPGNTDDKPPHLMSQAAFARAKDVSRKTVTAWKKRGWVRMRGDLVDVAATTAYMKKYASSNAKGAHRPVTLSGKVTVGLIDALPYAVSPSALRRQDYDPDLIPDEVLAASTAIASGAAELGWLLLRTLPVEAARALVAEWVSGMTAGYVGDDDSGLSPVADEWPLPIDGHAAWHLHPLFTRPAMSAVDWDDAQDHANEWRAERGLAPL